MTEKIKIFDIMSAEDVKILRKTLENVRKIDFLKVDFEKLEDKEKAAWKIIKRRVKWQREKK